MAVDATLTNLGAGARLFGRACKLVIVPSRVGDFAVGSLVDALEIVAMRVQFKVTKDLKKNPNTAEISITNLAESTRKKIVAGSRVILEAGYAFTVAGIFSGDAAYVDHVRDGADWTTKIQCGDGARAFGGARVNYSAIGGTPATDVVLKLAGAMGIGVGNLDEQARGIAGSLSQGYAAQGNAAAELDRFLASRGLEWSIQDGQLQILKAGEAREDLAVELSESSGLIGSPEHGTPEETGGPPALRVKSLLQPSIKPGGVLAVKSASLNGQYRVVKVEHTGDTAGGDWYSVADVVPR